MKYLKKNLKEFTQIFYRKFSFSVINNDGEIIRRPTRMWRVVSVHPAQG